VGEHGVSQSAHIDTLAGKPGAFLLDPVSGNYAPLGNVVQIPFRGSWVYAPDSTLAPNGISVISAQGGGCNIRLAGGTPGFFDAPYYQVDFANGDDAADGIDNPLRTLDELSARLGMQQVPPGVILFVYLLGTPPVGPTKLLVNTSDITSGIAFLGERTTEATFTLSAVVSWNDGVGAVGTYTCAGAPDLSVYRRAMVRLATGASAGARAILTEQPAVGQFYASFTSKTTPRNVEPAVGDTIEIVTLTRLNGDVSIEVLGDGVVYFQDCDLGAADNHSVKVNGGYAKFVTSIVRGLDALNGTAEVLCGGVYEIHSDALAALYGTTHLSVGGSALEARAGGTILTNLRTYLYGYGMSAGAALSGGGQIIASGPLMVQNPTSDTSFYVFPGGQIVALEYAWVRADAVVANGIKVFSGGRFLYAAGKAPAAFGTAPTVFAAVGGVARTAAQLPYFDDSSGNKTGASVTIYQ